MTTLKVEAPYVAIVHNSHLSATCSKCFKQDDTVRISRCLGCRFVYYCGTGCQKSDWKAQKGECKFLKKTGRLPSDDVRFVTRILCKSKEDKEFKAFNGRTYDSLLDHLDDFKAQSNSEVVFGRLCREVQQFMGDKAPDQETILQAIGKEKINAFPIFDGTPSQARRGVGLYIGLSIHDHSCDADCFPVTNGPNLVLRTLKKNLQYSKDLALSYLTGGLPMCTYDRRKRLLSDYFFNCNCSECLNVELDKKRTSGHSGCCSDGWFASAEPICSSCGKEVDSERIKKLENSTCLLDLELHKFHLKRDLYVSKSVKVIVSKLFEESKKICTDFNVYLLHVADLLLNFVFNGVCFRVNNNQTSDKDHADKVRQVDELIAFCLPFIRNLPPSTFTVDFLARRFLAVQDTRILKDMNQAAEEVWNMTKLVYGEDNETTLFLKPNVEQIFMVYNMKTKCQVK